MWSKAYPLESRGLDPEGFLPGLVRRDGLKILVQTFMRQIHGVGDSSHRLKADETASAFFGRKYDQRCVFRPEDDFDLLSLPGDCHFGLSRSLPGQIAEHIIQAEVLERDGLRRGE